MKQIWKYKLKMVDGVQEIEMPSGAEIIHADFQNKKPYIWAMINGTAEKTVRKLQIFGTGEVVYQEELVEDKSMKHISTSVINNYVWHIFEIL